MGVFLGLLHVLRVFNRHTRLFAEETCCVVFSTYPTDPDTRPAHMAHSLTRNIRSGEAPRDAQEEKIRLPPLRA